MPPGSAADNRRRVAAIRKRDKARAAAATKPKPKAPPIRMPDLEATLRVPSQPLQKPHRRTAVERSVVYKPPPGPPPAPHGGHVPITIEKAPILDVAFRPKPGSIRDRQIKAYNQEAEKQRRADLRAERYARDARKAEVRAMSPEQRKLVGKDRLHEYIRTGGVQAHGLGAVAEGVEGIGRAVGKGAASLTDAAANAVARKVEAAAGRPFRPRKPAPFGGDTAQTLAGVGKVGSEVAGFASDVALGPNITKALAGEDFNPKWLLAEMALVALPLKGLPTPVTAALRAAVGAKTLAAGERAGMTTAEILTRPVSEVRSARRASLRAAGAEAVGKAPIPSSRAAGAAARAATRVGFNPEGRVVRTIMNPVNAPRVLRVGGLEVPTAAPLSRSGKLARKGLDKIRDKRFVPLRGTQTLAMRKLGQEAAQKFNYASGLEHALDRALPRSWRKVDWAGIYAVRSVAKGATIQESIDTTARALAEAVERGDTIGAQANRIHLALFEKARKYVVEDAEGNPVFRPDAPPELEQLRATLQRVSGTREDILGALDKLSAAEAEGRVLKEQMFYAGAEQLPKDDFVAKALQANPIRQKIAAIWRRDNPQQAEFGLTIVDAKARADYENLVAWHEEEIARLQRAIDRNPLAPQNGRHATDIADHRKALSEITPDLFYNQINEVADQLPPEIIAKLSEDYGEHGTSWRFSIYDSEDEVRAASRRIADEIVESGLPLPPEWDTPEKVQEGIHNVFKRARDGESGKDWYPTAAEGVMTVSEATGVEPKIVAQLFAIYSQAADTIANTTFVFRAIREYQKYRDLFVGRFPSRQSAEALFVLKGGTWEGRKRSSFYANILRHIPGLEDEYQAVIKEMAEARGAAVNHPVTVDRWVVRMFRPGAEKDTPEKFYDTFETIIQKMADHVGWEPEQIQAAAWVSAKQLGFENEIAKAGGKVKGTLAARLAAGSEDAFQYGIQKNLARMEEPLGDVTPQMNRLANQANKRWGGFTLNRNLKPVRATGYSVSMSLTERAFKLHGLKGADIKQFRDDYEELLKDPRNKIGGFSDDPNEAGDATEVTLLSITRHFKDKDEALAFAREQGQETVYEYKTGDGIRTGLTRHEQRAIIDALDDEHLMGGPRGVWRQPTPEEQAYKEFLNRAAIETGHAKPKKDGTILVSESQRNRTEEWLSKNARQFEDEPLIQEWYDFAAKTSDELPHWMVEPAPSPEAAKFQRDVADDQLHYSLFGEDGEVLPDAEAVLQGKGAVEAAKIPGYDDAVAALARQEVPTDFIRAVVNSPLHVYKKQAIGRHLDSLSGGVLKGRDWDSIPGAKRSMFPDVMTLAGLWEGESRALYFSKEAHPVDWIHEFTHVMETADMFPPGVKDVIWRHVGAEPGEKLTHDQSEDMADMISAVILGHDPSKSKLPKDVSNALLSVQRAMKKDIEGGARAFFRENAALAKLPEEERIFLEDIFTFRDEEAALFTNGFKPRPGQYLPEKPGLPFGSLNPLAPRRTATLWNRLLGGKKVVNVTPTDAHLTHEWRGELIRSGRWEKSVVNGPLEGLLKAYQIDRMKSVHDKLIEIGWAQPTTEYGLRDWVMVPVDPKGWTDKTRSQARDIIDILRAFDTGEAVDSVKLGKVDAQAVDQIKDFMFPGMTDDSSARIVDLVRQALAKPIDGVFWVPKPMLMKTGLFDSPLVPALSDHALAKGVVYGVDTLNNIMKMMVLSANPAYYPMNMIGQNIMLASQLGFTAPFSLAKSLAQAHRLAQTPEGEEVLALIDRFAGTGFAGAQFLTEGGALQRATNTFGKIGTILIDKYPRRMSFMHEARRLGYRTDAQLEALVTDMANFDDLMRVHERTLNAMVDYGNLNRIEKGIAAHLIFVYPWLRGSSRYTANFAFDHPIQAALFAGLVYWQQNRLQEALPEYPGYMKWYLPISQEDGENPYGFRMDQLATPLQTLDIAAMLVDWGSGGHAELPWGSNEEHIGSMLGPLAEEIEKTMTGWDSFTREEVSRGIPQLFTRILDPRERWASWRRLEKVLNHETHKGIYDTTQTQNWLRLFLGSLAPINVDIEKAEEIVVESRGTPSAAQSRDAYVKKIEEVGGKPLAPEEEETIRKWKTADQAYRKISRQYRDDHDIEGDSTIQERAAILLLTVAELNPAVAEEATRRSVLALQASDDEAQAAYDELREALGLKQLATLDGRIRKAQLAQRTEP